MKNKTFALLIMLMTLLSTLTVAAEECLCTSGIYSDACCGETLVPEPEPVVTCNVEINGDEIYPEVSNRVTYERGDEWDVKVRLTSTEEAKDVQIVAEINGIEYETVYDSTKTFDLKPDRTYIKHLTLELPDNMDAGLYNMKIRVVGADSASVEHYYNIDVVAAENDVVITDILLDPSSGVVSGRGLLASVRVKNMGLEDEESLKVTVSIPALGIQASEYVDELKADEDDGKGESATTEDLYLRIPKCVDEGTYVVRAVVTYQDGHEQTSDETTIDVYEDETCGTGTSGEDGTTEDKTVITVPGKQEIAQGGDGVVYPIMVSNTGSSAKTYTLAVAGVDSWGTYRIDPSNVMVVSGKKTETAYLYLSANKDASVGEKVFMVSITTGDETEQVPLTIGVIQGEDNSGNEQPIISGDWSNIRRGLEIGLVVLVVLLVILGLIVGFNKLKGDDDDEPEEISGQTYY